MPSPLTHTDYEHLAQSYLTPELLAAAGWYRVDGLEGAATVGKRHWEADYAGVVIPYRYPGETCVRGSRLRRDVPDRIWKDGKMKDEAKYLSAPGAKNRFYFPPATTVAQLDDTRLPICLVEGEKKCLALSRYFGESRQRCLPIGIPGVWAWRGKIGRQPGPEPGEWIAEKGPIADFDLVNWQGRRVCILFDANVRTNADVRHARLALTEELVTRGAVVLWAEIPDLPGVNGIDDLLGLQGPEAARRVFQASQVAPTPRKQAEADQAVREAQARAEAVERTELAAFWRQLKNRCSAPAAPQWKRRRVA